MEIKGYWLANICGVTRQNVYMLTAQGKLTKSESGKYNIYDPKNARFLKTHNKSKLDVKEYLDTKDKPKQRRSKLPPAGSTPGKNQDDSIKLIKSVERVIFNLYGKEASQKIKYEIMQEFKK